MRQSRESISDFIAKKREIFLLQVSYDPQGAWGVVVLVFFPFLPPSPFHQGYPPPTPLSQLSIDIKHEEIRKLEQVFPPLQPLFPICRTPFSPYDPDFNLLLVISESGRSGRRAPYSAGEN